MIGIWRQWVLWKVRMPSWVKQYSAVIRISKYNRELSAVLFTSHALKLRVWIKWSFILGDNVDKEKMFLILYVIYIFCNVIKFFNRIKNILDHGLFLSIDFCVKLIPFSRPFNFSHNGYTTYKGVLELYFIRNSLLFF